jgi:hypothetical protein
MQTRGRADQVYQLTLTELAFIVIFLILLLAGWMSVKTEREKEAAVKQRDEALAKLAELTEDNGAAARLEYLHESLRRAEQDIRQLLAGQGSAHPDDIVSELVKQGRAEAESRRLRKRIEDLDAQLSALEEIRKIVDESASEASGGGDAEKAHSSGRDSARAEMLAALKFKRAVEKELGDAIAPGREREKALEYAEAVRAVRAGPADSGSVQQLAKENRDLRAQAAWMRSQLDARGGRDYPPCWVEENTGKPQYLFTVEIRDGGLRIDPAWPPERNGDARRLPGMDGLAGAGPLGISAFRARVQALDEDSRAKNCRHYIRLVNRVGSLAAFNRHRYAVEEFFYKFEIR